ncbi:MAG: DUF2341 domain-containing protein [Candidatus Bathyarchaeia archaeon]
MGWLTGWSYRKSHIINYASGAGTNYQVRIVAHYGSGTDSGADVYLNSHCRTDFGDVRFTDDDGTTLLDYWMETKVDSDYAIFWVEVADDLSSANATIYVYYGKSDATTTSNGDNTFLFFDDFDSNNGWTLLQGAQITNGYLYLATRSNPYYSCGYKSWSPPSDYRFIFKFSTAITDSYIRAQVRGRNAPTGYHITRPVDESPHYRIGDYFYNPLSAVNFLTQGGVISSPTLNPARDSNVHTATVCKSGSTFKNMFDTLQASATDNTTETGNYVAFMGQWLSSPAYIYVVYITKYVDPEPSHGSWGSEETSSGGQTYEISVDAISQSLATPAYETTYNISKYASVASQSLHASETNFSLAKDIVVNLLADALVEVVVGVVEIFRDATAAAQATFTFESVFNISPEAMAQALTTVGVEAIFNLVKDVIVKSSADPQVVGVYQINKDALVGAYVTPSLQQILGIDKDALVVSVSTPLIQSAFGISPEAVVKLLAEVAVVKEGEVKVTKLFLIIGDLAIQIQGG